MKAFRRTLSLLLFLALWLPAGAVTDSLRFNVRGTVRDSGSGKPLEVVSVSIPGTTFATVTNADGSFVIKSDIRPAFVSFSLLGYNSLTLPYEGSALNVSLRKGSLELDAAYVTSGDPVELVRYAIMRIVPNSPEEPELFDCFYRETVRKRQRFIYVSEAVTKVYKSTSGRWGRDRAAVVKSRLLTSPKQSDTLSAKLLGGPAMAVDLDLVKMRTFLLDETELPLYRFELLPPEIIDGRDQFVIRFSPAVDREYALHQGIMYIDRQTFAFTRIQASLDVSDPVKATRSMLVRKPAGLRFKPKEMSLTLNYSLKKGKCRLSYLKTQFRFNCDWRKRLFATDFTVVSEMVVTSRHTGDDAVPVQRSEEFNSRVSLADNTELYADPEFWADYNIIEPTIGLEQAVRRLKKQNK